MAAGLQAWSVFGRLDILGFSRMARQLDLFGGMSQRLAGQTSVAAAGGAALAGSIAVIGLAAGAVAVESVRAFSEFDAAMTQSMAIMGNLSDIMRTDMMDAARSVAKETTFSATEAAESFFFLASAGMSAEESITALPVVATFAQAGMFDMARATDILTDAVSALGLSSDDATENMMNLQRVGNALVAANTLANASVEQFGQSLINRAGPRMRQFGIDVEEGVAVLAAFADQGIKARLAGSQFNILLRDLTAAAVENEEAFAALNIRVFDSEGNLRAIADIVEDFENRLAGATDAQRTAAFGALQLNQRVADALSTLLGTSNAIREYEEGIRGAGNIMEEVAERQLQTFRRQLELFGSEIRDIFIEIGTRLNPAVESMTKLLRDNADLIRNVVLFAFESLAAVVRLVAWNVEIFTSELRRLWNLIPQIVRETNPLISSIEFLNQAFRTNVAVREAMEAQNRAFVAQLNFARRTISDTSDDLNSLISTMSEMGKISEEEVIRVAEFLREYEGAALTAFERMKMLAELPPTLSERFQNAEDHVIRALFAIRNSLEDIGEVGKRASEEAGEGLSDLDEILESLKQNTDESTSAVDSLVDSSAKARDLFSAMKDNNKISLDLIEEMRDNHAKILEMLKDENISRAEQIALLREAAVAAKELRDAEQGITPDRQRLRPVSDFPTFMMDTDLMKPSPQVAARLGRRIGEVVKEGSDNALADLAPHFERLGARLIESLAFGTLTAGEVARAAVNMIARFYIMPGLISVFGIASPSKWMMDRGRDLMMGLAQGITQNATLVSDAMRGAMGPVQNIAMAGTHNLSGGFSSVSNMDRGFSLNVEGLSKPTNPLASIRDVEWQQVLSRSIKVLQKQGLI